MQLTDYHPQLSTTILLVGQPGSGKTTLALQFPKPLWIADLDNKLEGPVRWLKENKPDDLTHISYDTINTQPDLTDSTKLIPTPSGLRFSRLDECLQNALSTTPDLKTIVIDSLTALQEIIMFDIFRQRERKAPVSEEQYSKCQTTEPEWGLFARSVNHFFTKLQAQGKIVIVTAHEEARQNNQTQIYEQTIAIQGSSRYKLAGMFSNVLNLTTMVDAMNPTEIIRKTRTIPTQEYDKRGLQTSLSLPVEFPTSYDTIKEQLEQ